MSTIKNDGTFIKSDIAKIKIIKLIIIIFIIFAIGAGVVFVILDNITLKLALLPLLLFVIMLAFICIKITNYNVLGENQISIGDDIVSVEDIISVKKIFQDKNILHVKYHIEGQDKTVLLVSPREKPESFYPENFKNDFTSKLERFLKGEI